MVFQKSIFESSRWLAGFSQVGGFLLVIGWALCCPVAAEDGRKIYLAQCAECHGESGEGVEGASEQPLRGVMTLFELEEYIEGTMPEGNPGDCVGENAKQVARFVYDSFYSLEARNRNNPPRYVFSRLTSEQYRSSVADLLSAYLGRQEKRPQEHGLQATYYDSRSMQNNKKVNQRIDAAIDFDFGTGAPEKVTGKEFAIRWSGSLIAAESGEYELIVHSANSVRLRLNNERTPLVDANVVSGDRSEYREKISLIGGRLYDLTIDCSRYKEKEGFVQLRWVRPSGVEEVIPAWNLTTQRVRSLPVLETRFPPDDESYGYPRGISISREWSDAVTRGAMEAGQLVSRDFERFVPRSENRAERKKRAIQFCRQIAEMAFRRELSKQEQELYLEANFRDQGQSLQESTRRTVALILESPRFLYLDLDDASTRPAFTLARTFWDSLPDSRLLEAEKSRQLVDGDRVDRVLVKMLEDQRARAKIRSFFVHYLKLNDLKGLVKDRSVHPEFSESLVADLKRSLLIQIDQLVWEETASFPQLFQTKVFYLNQELAKFYDPKFDDAKFNGAPGGAIAGFRPVSQSGGGRGLLTHPLLMSGFAYAQASSPIHRGVFVAQNILGRRLNPPPDAFPPFDGEIARSWTTREKVVHQTQPISCQRCHGLINPLGFAFENYDEVGRIRRDDNGKKVDTGGQYRTREGKLIKYEGGDELSAFLSKAKPVRQHFVEEMFQYLVKQPLAAYGPEAADRLVNHFEKNNQDIQKLIVEIGKIAAFCPPNR